MKTNALNTIIVNAKTILISIKEIAWKVISYPFKLIASLPDVAKISIYVAIIIITLILLYKIIKSLKHEIHAVEI